MTNALGPQCPSCGYAGLAGDEFCEACGQPVRVGAAHDDLDLGVAAAVTDRGLVHTHNEDAFSLHAVGPTVVAVVCDGVSSSVAPELAAQAAASAAGRALEHALEDALEGGFDRASPPSDGAAERAQRATRDAVAAAQGAVSEIPFAPADALAAPSCTFVSALWDGLDITVGSVGDSRAYWIGREHARCLTVDDSWVQSQVDGGHATHAEAEQDARAHAITHWIGADAPRDPPKVVTFRPDESGHLVVCTDGLWNYMPDANDIAAAVLPIRAERPAAIARSLVRTAIARGGRDNVTVAVVEVTSGPTDSELEGP